MERKRENTFDGCNLHVCLTEVTHCKEFVETGDGRGGWKRFVDSFWSLWGSILYPLSFDSRHFLSSLGSCLYLPYLLVIVFKDFVFPCYLWLAYWFSGLYSLRAVNIFLRSYLCLPKPFPIIGLFLFTIRVCDHIRVLFFLWRLLFLPDHVFKLF